MTVTRKIAYAAGRDAGNASMRQAQRVHWNEDDFNAAARVAQRLLALMPEEVEAAHQWRH